MNETAELQMNSSRLILHRGGGKTETGCRRAVSTSLLLLNKTEDLEAINHRTNERRQSGHQHTRAPPERVGKAKRKLRKPFCAEKWVRVDIFQWNKIS